MKSFSIHTNVKLVNNYLNLQKMSSNNVLLCIKCLVILACTIMQKMSRNVHVNININMYYYKLCYLCILKNNHRRGGYDLFTNQNKRQLKRLHINNKIAIVQ